MADLEKYVGDEMYETVTAYEDGRSLVRDVPTGTLYFKKILSVYNISVFQYLKNHADPHIPEIHDFWKDGDSLVVIEELIQGHTLEETLGEWLPFEERKRILLEICDGLTFLHSAVPPIIHRDLKAANVMVAADGTVKIIDYDAAKIYTPEESSDTVLMGTQGVAAPEQYGFAASDARTDLFALGKLIQRMLPESKGAMDIARKATRMEMDERYSSASEMRRQLEKLKDPAEIAARENRKLDPEYRKKVRKKRAIAVIAAAAVLGAAYLIWGFYISPQMRARVKDLRGKDYAQIHFPADAGAGAEWGPDGP